jgi:hypothetical protein
MLSVLDEPLLQRDPKDDDVARTHSLLNWFRQHFKHSEPREGGPRPGPAFSPGCQRRRLRTAMGHTPQRPTQRVTQAATCHAADAVALQLPSGGPPALLAEQLQRSLAAGQGGGEHLAALFVALLRALGMLARSVRWARARSRGDHSVGCTDRWRACGEAGARRGATFGADGAQQALGRSGRRLHPAGPAAAPWPGLARPAGASTRCPSSRAAAPGRRPPHAPGPPRPGSPRPALGRSSSSRRACASAAAAALQPSLQRQAVARPSGAQGRGQQQQRRLQMGQRQQQRRQRQRQQSRQPWSRPQSQTSLQSLQMPGRVRRTGPLPMRAGRASSVPASARSLCPSKQRRQQAAQQGRGPGPAPPGAAAWRRPLLQPASRRRKAAAQAWQLLLGPLLLPAGPARAGRTRSWSGSWGWRWPGAVRRHTHPCVREARERALGDAKAARAVLVVGPCRAGRATLPPPPCPRCRSEMEEALRQAAGSGPAAGPAPGEVITGRGRGRAGRLALLLLSAQ